MDTQPAAIDQRKYQPEASRLDALVNQFTYHAPKDDQPARYETLRAMARQYAQAILELTPPSREQSVALTHLETATFWANAAIARNE